MLGSVSIISGSFCIKLMNEMKFSKMPPSIWKISNDIELERTEKLLNAPSFENIVKNIIASVRNIHLKRELCKDKPGHYRVVATLECENREPVDLFHNAATGYRAQYLKSPELGDKANEYAAISFRELILEKLLKRKPRGWKLSWAKISILNSSVKVWIHQGRWLRYAKESCQDLIVDKWNKGGNSVNSDIRKKKRYGRMLPGCENRIDYKRVWVSERGKVIQTFKPDRATCINLHGFT